MLTQNKIKFIKSLEQKKYRKKHGCFIVEGEKMVNELINSDYKVIELYHTSDFPVPETKDETSVISSKELKKISQLKTPNKVLAIAGLPESNSPSLSENDITLMLEDVQDPGNLGTIIRTAAWYGIKNIICSNDTVDAYNPKVVQATMGALFKVRVTYTPLFEVLDEKQNNLSVFGAALNGENIYKMKLPKSAVIVMGNESKGISPALESRLDTLVKLPSFPENNKVESLNVSVATALICAEFRRQKNWD